jgi:hypothetical protein
MSAIRLALLTCPQCGAPLTAEGEDVLYYCSACRSAFELEDDGAGGRLTKVEVAFVARPNVAPERYLPFWLLPARVLLERRETAGGSFSGLVRFFTEGGQATAESGAPRELAFAIPAWGGGLRELVPLARRYTEALPQLGEKLGERLTGGRLSQSEAGKLAHYVLIASEADKPDTLQQLAYRLELGRGWLLGVPFVRHEGRLVDALFGLPAGLP